MRVPPGPGVGAEPGGGIGCEHCWGWVGKGTPSSKERHASFDVNKRENKIA